MADFKLAHLSDLHLQYRSSSRKVDPKTGVNLREMDGYKALAQCVKEIIDEKCDAAVIAGDIFHVPSPSIRAIVFAQNQFRKLAEAGVKIYALGGNHDTLDVREDISAARVLNDPMRSINSTAEPYVRYEIADGIHIHLVSHHLYTLQQDTMKEVVPVPSEINIFSTHGSVIDPLLKMKLHAEQSPREVVIPDRLLKEKDWSYILLGHIHERGWVGSKDLKTDTSKTRIYYNGSTIRRGFSDKETPLGRGWTLWTISQDGTFTPDHRMIHQRTQKDFATIDAKNLSAAEISDRIVENLKATQISGPEFDHRFAPMLRQTISGISSSKYSALDWKTISDNSSHALQWSIKQMSSEEEAKDGKVAELSNEEILNSGDIVKIYDDWIEESKSLQESPEAIREEIEIQARGFIQLGQETILESE